jgi:hypothetical protein
MVSTGRTGSSRWVLGGFETIGLVRQFLLQRARQLNPDYALFLDADMVIKSRDLLRR